MSSCAKKKKCETVTKKTWSCNKELDFEVDDQVDMEDLHRSSRSSAGSSWREEEESTRESSK